MKILVTGSAGFIGFHLTTALLKLGYEVVGIDNINDYYDVELKYARLNENGIERTEILWNKEVRSYRYEKYRFIMQPLEDKDELMILCKRERFDVIVNLAAQAGVRYSILNPDAYLQSNLVGFLNILEVSRHCMVKHLIYASSSSVYGLNEQIPFSVSHGTNHPVSLYAATKKSNEMMAHAYSYLYNLPTTGLRFFTVYGAWGRPDMAYFSFTNAILEGKPIRVFNGGEMRRDFTYIDDIINGITKIIPTPAQPSEGWNDLDPDPSRSKTPFRIYNIGNNQPVNLLDFIETLEDQLGVKANKVMTEMQPGDVTVTYADVSQLRDDFDYRPSTPISKGIREFITWYREYYKVPKTVNAG
ncbi:MAG: NAD-dependent epimerase [Chitinophagaceae bacterium]|nr:MAG: NAD-dependent epimerase [Chitinophagaceae bacterium]